MKKLYRKGAVHPTPSVVSDHLLSFLPAAILTLTVALSPADREVLAYLISCSSASFSNNHRRTTPKTAVGGGSKGVDDHPTCFTCNCFRCYMSYWVKWDTSPNRQVIHEIIDAFEDSLLKENRRENNRRDRRKGRNVKGNIVEEPKKSELSLTKEDLVFVESSPAAEVGGETGDGVGAERGEEEDSVEEVEMEKGSVRRFMSYLGERIWSVWG